MNSKIRFLKKIPFGILLTIEVFLVALMNFVGLPVCVGAESSASSNSWMSRLPDNSELCDINIPGTHDSGTRYTTGVVSGIIASCQDDTILDQLKKGIRYLDIRCDGDLNIRHGAVSCYTSFLTISRYKLTLPKVLDDIESFLESNPGETVIMQIKKEGTGKGDFAKNVNNELKNRTKLYKSRKTQAQDPDDIKLKDVRGKFLVCSRSDGIDPAYSYRRWADDCVYSNTKLEESDCMLQDKYTSSNATDKLRIIKAFYEKIWAERDLKDKFIINFTSCIGPYCPEYVANRINPKFEDYVKENKGKKFGIVLMDVPKRSLISTIYNSNFS